MLIYKLSAQAHFWSILAELIPVYMGMSQLTIDQNNML